MSGDLGASVQAGGVRSVGHGETQESPLPLRLLDFVFLLSLLVVTVPGVTTLDIDYSRSRELSLVILLVGVATLSTWWRWLDRSTNWLVGSLAAGTVIGLLSWTVALGWGWSINFWSEWLMAIAFLLFGVTLWFSPRWQFVLIHYAVLLAFVQVGLILLSETDSTNGMPGFYSHRPLAASVALLFVVGMVLALLANEGALRHRTAIVITLGFSAVLSQARSVWLALIVSLALSVVSLHRRGLLRRLWTGPAATVGFFVGVLVLPLVVGLSVLPGGGEGSEGARSLPDSATSVGTGQWRLEMWQSRMSVSRSIIDWLTGGILGPTPAKGPGSQVMNPLITAHNVVVDLVTMFGLLGLAVVIVLFLRATLYSAARLGPLQIVLWGFVAYGVFYNWAEWCWAILGAALVASRNASRSKRLRSVETS